MKASIQARLENVCERHEEIAALLGEPDTINDNDKFRELSKEYSQLEPVVTTFTNYQSTNENLANAREMEKDSDPDMREMAAEELPELTAKLASLEAELQTLLLPRDPRDDYNAFLEIRAGTGGDEAAIFAGDLLRMYLRFAELKGWRSEIITERPGDHGGYKEVVCRLTGNSVFSQLKFDTSAATVAILPEADKVEEIDINPADLKTDTFRASGAGGQHVNKTDSAVRLTHVPSGIVVECQDERSQHKNRAKALALLQARILDIEVSKQQQEQSESRRLQVGSGDRSERIRTYNFPQGRMTDHRINLTLYKLEEVMQGALSEVIDPLIAEHQAQLLAEFGD